MRAELYEFLLENKFKNGIMFKRSIELFVEHYNMEGTVKEDSLMRAFKRWRKAMKDNENTNTSKKGAVRFWTAPHKNKSYI